MELLIIITLVIVSVLLIFILFRSNKETLKGKYGDWILTILGTFLGVYLAVFVNGKVVIANEKSQLTSFIHHAREEISQKKRQNGRWLKILNEFKDEELTRHLNDNLIYEPIILSKLIEDELLSKHALLSTTFLLNERLNMIKMLATVNDKNDDSKERENILGAYINQLSHLEKLLNFTILLVNGEITPTKFKKLCNEVALKKVFGEEYNKTLNQALHQTGRGAGR